MVIEIKMPQLGQTSDEVKLIRWLVEEGQEIKKSQPICEVETDKTVMELESFESGTVLKIIVAPDSIVPTGKTIAVIGNPSEKGQIGTYSSDKAEDDLKTMKVVQTVKIAENQVPVGENIRKGLVEEQSEVDIRATSLVKNLSKIKNIDLRLVKGTGPRGLITRDDLENYIKQVSEGSVDKVLGLGLSSQTSKQVEYKQARETTGKFVSEVNLPKSQVVVAANLTKSKQEIPHYYLKIVINACNLLNWRLVNKKSDGEKFSIYSIIIHSVAKCLKQMPKLNAYFKDNRIIFYKDINIGAAFAVDDELFVPVIKNADKKTIAEIDSELEILFERAKSKSFLPEDLSGVTFTITNLGTYGVEDFSAIINPLQAGILALGALRKVLSIEENESMHIRSVFTVTGSFDHRFVNGSIGAEFLGLFKNIIENDFV